MATLVLSAAGAAFGGSLGGSLFGLSSLVIGKAVGATVGSLIDQRLLGAGAAPVEAGRVDRLRVMGSSEGAPLPRCFGRIRVPGQLIWSSRFLENVSTQRVGGKGSRRGRQTVREYGYSISLALALCEGDVIRVGRIWADGQPLAQAGLTWRLHTGGEDQLPDPLIAAIEGEENAPAYRGTAYVVIEDLELAPFGNRIPQLNFEVFRAPAPKAAGLAAAPSNNIRAVALVPGTGEYALATAPVTLERSRGNTIVTNVNNDRGVPDFVSSFDQLTAELPGCEAVSLVVSWFGDDLRAGHCSLYPAVEQGDIDGSPMPWRVAGLDRAAAPVVSRIEDRPLFGGTPSDESVVQAIRHMADAGQAVMFYPFILMDILEGSGRPDPWNPARDQPPVPWRGRITLSRAPGVAGSPDKSPAAAAEVAVFFGQAAASDFTVVGGRVIYSGPDEWSYRRFILHYAHLCALAGGVEAFCIGSEMRSLTQIRDGAAAYPAVRALCDLAADVRSILGPSVKLSYAADWSEYFGHQPADGSGDVLFHLDPLWSHPAIDFVGIDNYMPLSDWRDGTDHRDAAAGSIYDLDYLTANVAGGEGFAWYYPDAAARDAQERAPIEDGAYGEPWVFRYKDIEAWWSQPHVDRIGSVKVGAPTAWVPRSKPIWFTELGCPAVDKGTNQPNVFFDPKSSESFFPYYSTGQRDDFIQKRYLQATFRHWAAPENNPLSAIYGGRMVELSRAFVWAWDARPWPDFPARLDTWVDGLNHERGHWLNGRVCSPAIAEVVAELCERPGLAELDLAQLHGCVTGYIVNGVETARQSLQPLVLAFGLDGHGDERGLVVASRRRRVDATILPDRLVAARGKSRLAKTRAPEAEVIGRVSVTFIGCDNDYQTGSADALAPDPAEPSTTESSLPIVLAGGEAREIVERWLAEARTARETVVFTLPPSAFAIETGDVVELLGTDGPTLLRIDRTSGTTDRELTAVKVDTREHHRRFESQRPLAPRTIAAKGPVHAQFLELPILGGDDVPHAPHLAVLKVPWGGPVAVYSSANDHGYSLNRVVDRPAVFGRLLDPLPAAVPGRWMRWKGRVRLDWGALQSFSESEVLNGANVAAIGESSGRDWEVIQFTSADLIGPLTYRIGGLLRGQAGTDGIMPAAWPTGSDFVLLDERVVQIDHPLSHRGLDRSYRIGPAEAGYGDPSYRSSVERFDGVGLRPYRPAHLNARRNADGSITIRWVRRTRVDGDNWQAVEVPLAEETALFDLRIHSGNAVRRSLSPTTTEAVYSFDQQASDGSFPPFTFEVAQVSARYGAGPYARIVFDD
jgi:hypothetical protein